MMKINYKKELKNQVKAFSEIKQDEEKKIEEFKKRRK